ncbi:hypothetical protein LTR36_000544 [Oleoguttula mirabilis]|uniref:F-box domain-containing protein n=1 Tax=Oleoguttula mirabilis TaxID=1507867 RepID=A0AAV9JSS3_9PEZI|nr:hypothetical protein LTR36_000544 [Oleoguttula mirabilis]
MYLCSLTLDTQQDDNDNDPELDSTETHTLTLPTAADILPIGCTSSHKQSRFLALPPELRVAIYEAVVLEPVPTLALLQTSRQIAMEAKPTLYQRHLTFASQANLFDWIGRSRSSNLKRVRTLTLRLCDVDLSPLFDSKRPKGTNAWSLYQSHIEKLEHAFASLPNVSELTITPPKAGHSQLLRSMYLSILALIARRYPKLKRLTINDTAVVLEKVPGLKQIGNVDFSVASKMQQDMSKERHDSVPTLPRIQSKKRSWTDRKTSKRQATADTAPKSKTLGRRIRTRREVNI